MRKCKKCGNRSFENQKLRLCIRVRVVGYDVRVSMLGLALGLDHKSVELQ